MGMGPRKEIVGCPMKAGLPQELDLGPGELVAEEGYDGQSVRDVLEREELLELVERIGFDSRHGLLHLETNERPTTSLRVAQVAAEGVVGTHVNVQPFVRPFVPAAPHGHQHHPSTLHVDFVLGQILPGHLVLRPKRKSIII